MSCRGNVEWLLLLTQHSLTTLEGRWVHLEADFHGEFCFHTFNIDSLNIVMTNDCVWPSQHQAPFLMCESPVFLCRNVLNDLVCDPYVTFLCSRIFWMTSVVRGSNARKIIDKRTRSWKCVTNEGQFIFSFFFSCLSLFFSTEDLTQIQKWHLHEYGKDESQAERDDHKGDIVQKGFRFQ